MERVLTTRAMAGKIGRAADVPGSHRRMPVATFAIAFRPAWRRAAGITARKTTVAT
jgi:hypothetical protein